MRKRFAPIALTIVSLWNLTLTALAQSVPSLINYQGRLTDQTGAPLAVGSYGIEFRLWDSPTATATNYLIWAQKRNVAVQANGVFDVILGAAGGSAIPGAATNDLASAFGSSNRFLGVTVVSSNGVSVPSASEILPRQQLLSVPFALETQTAAALISDLANALCPPGSIMAYMGTNPPAGWLLCDGSEVSRTNYARLFAVIRTSSGPGDGTNTFHLPDLRAMFLRGVNGSRSNTDYWDPDASLRTNAVAGGNVGNTVGSVQADEFRAHKHTTTLKWDFANGSGENFLRVGGPFDTPPYDSSLAGGNETRPKNVYVNYIIKY